MKLIEINNQDEWDNYVLRQNSGHPLQLWGWGEAKRLTGWTAHRLALMDDAGWHAVAQLLLWRVPLTKLYIAYVPRGPVGGHSDPSTQKLLTALVQWANEQKNILYIRVEPAWTVGALGKGWKKSGHTIQMSKTYTIDLEKSEDDLLSVMSHKHRQYIRKSERDGIRIVRALDAKLDDMYKLYVDTAKRAKFGIHDKAYYEALYRELGDQSYLYYATYNNQPVAFLWLVVAGVTAYELYGGVNKQGADLKANYFMKWQAIHNMKTAGCTIYDLNGRLNEGVSRFKEGFGPDETDYIGTYDYPVKQFGYYMWEYLWPLIKPVGRRLMRIMHSIKK